jgi:hypothetical protein
MPWIKDVCVNVICGGTLGIVRGIFGVSLFTADEVQEIDSLKRLALSVMEKAPKTATDPIICDAIKNRHENALEIFAKNASPEAVAAGVIATADVVCGKAFKERFTSVLIGACLNLIGC